MGNDNAKEKEKGGYSLQGASNSGPSGHVDSEQERQARAAAAEARANKAKPKKVQAGVRAAHFDRYEEIERQAQNRGGGADRKTPRGPDPIKCPACTFTATDESTIASHIETSHPVDPDAREARLKATENRLNSKPSSPSSSSRPSSSSPSNSASPDTGISCPMCGRSNFQSEAAVDVHIERDHGATASERDQRAKIVEERLKKSQRGGAAKQQQRKDENWQKYASMGGAVETDNKPENKTNEELARELDVEQAIKRFSSHIGRPEIVQASAKFISNILSKVANPPEPDQAEKYRKVNISNEKVREKIINVEGALEVLESIGFKIVTLPSASGNPEDYLLIQEPNKSLVEFAVQKLSGLSGQ